MPSPADKGRRLVSWKEVAAYLDVAVRTAQKWEKERSLPVHRRGTGSKPRVDAWTNEIDEWLDREDSHSRFSRAFTWILISSSSMVFLVLSLIYITKQIPSPEEVSISENQLVVRGTNGYVCFNKTFPNLKTTAYQGIVVDKPAIERLCKIVEMKGGSEKVVLFHFEPRSSEEENGALYCFDDVGSELWRFDYGRQISASDGFEMRQFNRAYCGRLGFEIVSIRKRDYILGFVHHGKWFPAQMFLLDSSTGNLLGEYWHPGWFQTFTLMNTSGDGVPEVLVGGVNNPGPGPGNAFLARVKLPFNKSPSKEDPYGFVDSIASTYLLFPRTATFGQKMMSVTKVRALGNGRVTVTVYNGSVGGIHYEFDEQLSLLDYRPDNKLWISHSLLEKNGNKEISQSEVSAWGRVLRFKYQNPNANSPTISRLFEESPICDGNSQSPCLMTAN